MRNNLTKKTVRRVPTLELAIRFNQLMLMGETMPAGVITMADARETLWIEDELRRRLLAAIGHDFYPPDGVARPTIAELKASIKTSLITMARPVPQPAHETVQPAGQTKGILKFKVAIINSIGSTVKTLNLHVFEKNDAETAARKVIEQLGLKKAKYKIS